ncbi:MAG: TROVE domain-containing protein [Tannerellaceae bacterium]|nr:TROVE domain-containing protein [Tannerellaceae bacterium]
MKFNVTNKGMDKVLNHEGAPAYRLSAELSLYSAVVTSLQSDFFYEKAERRRICELIAQSEPLFVAQLAVYARTKMNLRSVPLVLAVELAKVHKGDDLLCRMVSRIVQRADEITKLLAYYQVANNRGGFKKLNRLSKQLQAGLQEAFNRFDEYQFAKYNRDTAVGLRDALFLVHPKAKNEEQQMLFNKIVKDMLETPYTWETELSAVGQVKYADDAKRALAFRAKWEELIDSRKMGYMALMRNLQNIMEANVSSEHMTKVCVSLSSAEAVRRSRQLPFRFLSAYREVSRVPSLYAGRIMDALEEAVWVSTENIAGFNENTNVLLACDVSASMQKPVSPKSKVQLYDIGLMLAMLLKSHCKNVISGMFGSSWKVMNMPSKSILSNVDAFYRREGEVGYATNGYLVVEYLLEKNIRMDKVMIFTDIQLWNSVGDTLIWPLWRRYKNRYPSSRLYLFDLAGYGTTPLNVAEVEGVYLIAGWSDKIFNVLSALENNESTLSEIRGMTV